MLGTILWMMMMPSAGVSWWPCQQPSANGATVSLSDVTPMVFAYTVRLLYSKKLCLPNKISPFKNWAMAGPDS